MHQVGAVLSLCKLDDIMRINHRDDRVIPIERPGFGVELDLPDKLLQIGIVRLRIIVLEEVRASSLHENVAPTW